MSLKTYALNANSEIYELSLLVSIQNSCSVGRNRISVSRFFWIYVVLVRETMFWGASLAERQWSDPCGESPMIYTAFCGFRMLFDALRRSLGELWPTELRTWLSHFGALFSGNPLDSNPSSRPLAPEEWYLRIGRFFVKKSGFFRRIEHLCRK